MNDNEFQEPHSECNPTDFWNNTELDELEAFSQNDISGYLPYVIGNAKSGTLPSTKPEIYNTYDALENLKNQAADLQSKEKLSQLQKRLLNYADAKSINPVSINERDTEWATRHNLFEANRYGNKIFDVKPNPFISVKLPADIYSQAQKIYDEYGYGFDFIKGNTKNELLAALMADKIFGIRDITDSNYSSLNKKSPIDQIMQKATALNKSRHYAGPNASPEAIYSLSNDFQANVISRYGLMAKEIQEELDLQEKMKTIDDKISANYNAENIQPLILTRDEKKSLIDDFIRTFKRNNINADWLEELKNVDFDLTLANNSAEPNVGGYTDKNELGLINVKMNLNAKNWNSPTLTNNMKAEILHELRHVWQLTKEEWNKLFSSGPENKIDIDVEVDAFDNQYLYEKLLNINKTDNFKNLFFNENIKDSNKLKRYRQRLTYEKYKKITDKYCMKRDDVCKIK